MRALGLRVTGLGAEHVPTEGPVLLAATHVSYPDFVFVQEAASSSGRHVRFMTRHDVWHVPGVARAMTAMRHVPVDREAPAGAYVVARRLLRCGEAVCAFPEAGISYSYTVRSLMRGVASLARETGACVVPVAVWGPQRVWSVGMPDARGREPRPDLTRGRRVDVSFGPPLAIAPGEDKAAQLAGIVRRFRQGDDDDRWGPALDHAHEVARHLSATRDPSRDVLCHGDPHPGNALQANGIPRYKLVDPDGFRCEPEYDVGVTVRDFSREVLASRDHETARRWHDALCDLAADLTGTDTARVRQWAFVERVTTGLSLRWYRDEETAESFLDAATVLLPD